MLLRDVITSITITLVTNNKGYWPSE